MRKVLYPWHPWAGHNVHIHEVIEKADAAVFRCSVSGAASDRWLEVAAWMFDQAACATWRIDRIPHVDLAGLGSLATLLQEAVSVSAAASQLRDSSAALVSHDTNRGDVHAAPAHDIPVRSVLQSTRRRDDADAARQTLPVETRRTLTRLMVRLILDHADGERAPERGETRHDA